MSACQSLSSHVQCPMGQPCPTWGLQLSLHPVTPTCLGSSVFELALLLTNSIWSSQRHRRPPNPIQPLADIKWILSLTWDMRRPNNQLLCPGYGNTQAVAAATVGSSPPELRFAPTDPMLPYRPCFKAILT